MTVPAADATTPRRVPRMAYDVVRLSLAAVAGLVLTAVLLSIPGLAGFPIDPEWIVIGLFSFSAGSSLFYMIHTWWVFGRVDGATLRSWLIATDPHGRMSYLGAELSGTGPTIAVQWSVVAVGAVLVFTIWPGLLDRPVTVLLSVIVVAVSWSVTAVAYAVHYARIDAARGGLTYPDATPRVFWDYFYLSVQVQTTFSTSDVSLTSTAARKVVTGHTLVSFAFNTVIIAMLIAVLFLGVSARLAVAGG